METHEKPKKIKKIGKFNLLEENVCNLKCKCGWNLWIGGEDKEDLLTIKMFLKSFTKVVPQE